MFFWPFALFSVLYSLLLTGAIRHYARVHGLMDIPNERSSHSAPMPRGGGVAIVLTFLLGLAGMAIADILPIRDFWALLGAGAWVGLIGWLDDQKNIPAGFRLLAHFIGAGWALAWLGGLPPLPVFGLELELGIAGNLLAAVYLAWLLNLYNFMDGIDGIAGIQTLTVCAGAVVLYALFPGGDSDLWMLPVLLAAAAAGFLFWNFPRAKVFMGDSGSGFLGLMLGLLSIQASWVAPELFWGWTILLGTFIVDTTVTLLRRIWRMEKFYKAHRSHVYQHAAHKYGSHSLVSLSYAAITMFWLWPVASLVALGLLDGFLGVIIAYVPLILAALRFGAGKKQTV